MSSWRVQVGGLPIAATRIVSAGLIPAFVSIVIGRIGDALPVSRLEAGSS